MQRQLDRSIETRLLGSALWNNKLKDDCRHDKVFMAIRNNAIDFYHKGGKLFGFNGKDFKTHFKYASVIPSAVKDYLTEKELKALPRVHGFEENYERIKENCKLFSGVEALGVSALYNNYSYLSAKGNVVVLDIEVSFESKDEGRSQDRLDILLLDKNTRTLRFVEAKHFTNSEIWAKKVPPVVSQIERYKEQVETRRPEILTAYSQYVDSINSVFGCKLQRPVEVDENVTLLVFGFDRNQQQGRMKELITANNEYKGVHFYSIGNIDGVVPVNLWNEAKPL